MRSKSLILLTSVSLAGCADLVIDPDASPAALVLSDEIVTVWEDEPIEFGVTVVDRRGNPIRSVPGWADLTWMSSNVFVVAPATSGLQAVAPGEAIVAASLSGLRETATVRVNPRSAKLEIARSVLSQSGSPTNLLQAGVATTIQVYLTADRINYLQPEVAVTLSLDGQAVHTLRLESPGESIPRFLNTFDPGSAWTGVIPGEHFLPGIRLTIEADPEGIFEHTTGSRDRYPVAGAFAVPVGEAAVQLDLAGAYLTQSVQRFDGTVPLVEGRDALLRVFLAADEPNDLGVSVRATFFDGDAIVYQTDVLNGAGSVPQVIQEANLTRSWNTVIPGSVLAPGVTMVIEADPGASIPRKLGSVTRFPETGTLPLNVRAVPPLSLRMIPILQTDIGETGDITGANLPAYIQAAATKFPLSDIDADIRVPYLTSSLASTQSGWIDILTEIRALRVADNSFRYYYGVLRHPGGNGIGGLGYIGFPVAVGFDHPALGPETFAHELGHNFNLRHAPCGGASDTDPQFPYLGAGIGHFGYDFSTGTVMAPADTKDLMSYCSPEWISDYNYEKVLTRRETHDWGVIVDMPQDALLVWGGVAGGEPFLEPAFRLSMIPREPSDTGRYEIRGLDSTGRAVFSYRFEPDELDHQGARGFAFAIPSAVARPDELAEIIFSGPEGVSRRGVSPGQPAPATRPGVVQREIAWNAAESAVALVRDAATGQVLSFARGGRIVLPARQVEVITSDGVRSTSRTFDLR